MTTDSADGIRITPKLNPVGYRRGEALWDAKDLNAFIAEDINHGNYFYARVKDNMSIDFEKATKTTEDMLAVFNGALNKLIQKETEVSDSAKRVSGNVRKAANELNEGLQRIEKVANFQNLERYASVLERAASALTILADLEKSGSLEKISKAMK